MKTYQVRCRVKSLGYLTVFAESKEEAISMLEGGDGVFIETGEEDEDIDYGSLTEITN